MARQIENATCPTTQGQGDWMYRVPIAEEVVVVMLRGEREVVVILSLLATEMRRNAMRLDKAYFLWHMMGCKDMLESASSR